MVHHWTKETALLRAQENELLQIVCKKEPRLQAVIDYAANQESCVGYNTNETYTFLKEYASLFVGWCALDEELATTACYDTVIATILDLLPPDDWELYTTLADMPEARKRAWEDWEENQPNEFQEHEHYTVSPLPDLMKDPEQEAQWQAIITKLRAGALPPGYQRDSDGKIVIKTLDKDTYEKVRLGRW